ncbi:hypothetical protein D3C75_1349270 [compost metagenome]
MGRASVDGGVSVTPVSTGPVSTGSDWKKFGLWAVLLLSVLFLATMAFSLLRKPPANP